MTPEEKRRLIGQKNQADRRDGGQQMETDRRAVGARIEQDRTGSGARMESARRAGGQSLEDDRRSSGARMEAERNMKGYFNALVDPPGRSFSLPELEARGAVLEKKGVGVWDPSRVPGARGIAGPLFEMDFKKRLYWPGGTRSSDGLFNFPNLKRMVLMDTNGAEVVVDFPDPNATP